MPRIIKLNVGGHIFHTAATTLTSSTYFSRLLSSEFSDLDATSGDVFVDRDGRYFGFILAYLRSGAVELPQEPLSLDGLLAEAEYFGVDGLLEALRDASMPQQIKQDLCLRADGDGFDHQPQRKTCTRALLGAGDQVLTMICA